MEIKPGDIYWLQTDHSDIAHPHVIVQVDAATNEITACALTSNRNKISIPGNILLENGEGNLTRQSLVEVSKLSTVNSVQLGAYIGTVSPSRVAQIQRGIRFLQRSFLE